MIKIFTKRKDEMAIKPDSHRKSESINIKWYTIFAQHFDGFWRPGKKNLNIAKCEYPKPYSVRSSIGIEIKRWHLNGKFHCYGNKIAR